MSDYGIELGKMTRADKANAAKQLALIWDDDLQQAQLLSLTLFGGGGTGGVDPAKALTANWNAGPFLISLAGIKAFAATGLTLQGVAGQGMTVTDTAISLSDGITTFNLNKAKLVGTGGSISLGIIVADAAQAKIGDLAVINKAGDTTVKTLKVVPNATGGLEVTADGETNIKGQATHFNDARIYSPSDAQAGWPAEIKAIPQRVRPLEKSVWLAHADKPGYGYSINDDGSLDMYAATGLRMTTDGPIEVVTETKKDAGNNPIRYIYVDADGYLNLGGKGLKLNFEEQTGTGEVSPQTLTGDNPTLTFDDTVGSRGTFDIGLKSPSGSFYADYPEFQIRRRSNQNLGISIVGSTNGGGRVIVKPLRTKGTAGGAIGATGAFTFLGESNFPWDTIYTTGAASVQVASDGRIKEDVRDTEFGLAFIRQLRPVDYTHLGTGYKEHGFIAQEVAKTGFFGYTAEDDDSHWLAPLLFIAPTVRALQEIDQRVTALETKPKRTTRKKA